MKRPITAEDFEKDPTLADKGYSVGDEYDFPEEEVNSEKSTSNEQSDSNEGGENPETPPTGGSQPPVDKKRD